MSERRREARPAPRREPFPSQDRLTTGLPGCWLVAITVALVIGFAWIVVAEHMRAADAEAALSEYTSARYPTRDGLTYTYVNDPETPPICVYVVTDPDTGREYLVSDRGGITPRMGVDNG